MTEPSQYFKGRTVQEQMDEVIGYVDVRAAEVATTAIASDVAQVHQDMLDADADAQAAAASAAAAVGTLANAVKKTGEASQSIAGDIAVAGDLTGGSVTVPAPVNNTDAASKKYVDDQDALKADKTYVDAQDALKISITDINSYAVGLTGNQAWEGVKRANTTFSHGVTSADMLNDPETSIGAVIESFVDKMYSETQNSIGSMTRVRNSNGENYLDLISTSYGYVENDVQQQIDIFIRLLINDNDGSASLIFYRSKHNTDGTGTTDTKSKILAHITASGVIN